MIKFDHVALTVSDLEKAIKFYEIIGYKVLNIFEDEEYRWANLELNGMGLELFQMKDDSNSKIEHIAYSFDNEKELKDLLNKMDRKRPEVFYGDLNRETIFINDIDGHELQFIRK